MTDIAKVTVSIVLALVVIGVGAVVAGADSSFLIPTAFIVVFAGALLLVAHELKS